MNKLRINTLKGELTYSNGAYVLCQVDEALCKLSGNQETFRLAELRAWIEGLCEKVGLDINTLDMNPIEEPTDDHQPPPLD